MRLTHKYSEHLLRQASQRPLRAWEAGWLKRHLSGCDRCSATAAELAHFIQASARLAPSTAVRVSQRLHAALQEEGMAKEPALRAGWAMALVGAGAAAALALMLLPGLFSSSAGDSHGMASLSLPQGPAQSLNDPLQPAAQLPNTPSPEPAALKPTPATIPTMAAAVTETPAPLATGLVRPAFTATRTPTSTSVKTPILARSLTDTAGLLTTPVPSLNPPTSLPNMSRSSPASSLTPSQSLPSIPSSSLAPAGQ